MTVEPFARPPVIIGHRGAAGLVPENTLPGFQRAVELGVDAVELDVHCCQGELVVIHDDTLDRTTNGHGKVAASSLEILQRMDAGQGSRIPLLADVFERLPMAVGINVELKGRNTDNLLADWLPRKPDRPILVSSFNHAALRNFQALQPHYPAVPLFAKWAKNAIEVALEFGSGYINLDRKLIQSRRMTEIQASGLSVLAYTVNDLEEARRLIQMGVLGVFTDRPDQISRATLESQALRSS